MTTTFETRATKARNSALAPEFTKFVASIPGPMTLLRAREDYNKFQSLDAERLRDIGLTQAEANAMTYADFINMPRR